MPVLTTRRVLVGLTGLALLFGAISVGGIIGWEYSNSDAFCTNMCHAVHPEEPESHQASSHARVQCVECHIGRIPTLHAMMVKTTHAHELVAMVTGYERPLTSFTMRPSRQSCELCHWPETFHPDRIKVISQYDTDEKSTETRYHLVLHTAGSTFMAGRAKGIHWHIQNRVRFVATDEFKQTIPWVEVTHGDGSKTVYQDVQNPLSDVQLENAEKHEMDCMDCHNREGHPFPNPEDAVDQAIAEGRLDRRLPFLKARIMEILESAETRRDNAVAVVEAMREQYVEDFPGAAAAYPDAIHRAEEFMKAHLRRTTFSDPEVTWKSFPDNLGHKDFPGCFRCHNGKHVSEEGQAIRLQCNLCHNIPGVQREGEPIPTLKALKEPQPTDHLDANFMHNHRFLADEGCGSCHGEIRFGAEGGSFCNNPACHGQSWPQVNLDARAPHPVALEGHHAEVWCHDCHQGEKRPVNECARCHEPPDEGHFQAGCDRCHAPVGWTESASDRAPQGPTVPHGLDGRESCTNCHRAESVSLAPPPGEHESFRDTQCTLCHRPGAGAPDIPHPLDGREACLTCHDANKGFKPAPQDHVGRPEEQCRGCHAASTKRK